MWTLPGHENPPNPPDPVGKRGIPWVARNVLSTGMTIVILSSTG